LVFFSFKKKDPIGRKKSIVVYGVVFLLGSSLQVGAHNLATMMAGRFIGGSKFHIYTKTNL
jgi:predicted MFS family arabinose efflux permease